MTLMNTPALHEILCCVVTRVLLLLIIMLSISYSCISYHLTCTQVYCHCTVTHCWSSLLSITHTYYTHSLMLLVMPVLTCSTVLSLNSCVYCYCVILLTVCYCSYSVSIVHSHRSCVDTVCWYCVQLCSIMTSIKHTYNRMRYCTLITVTWLTC